MNVTNRFNILFRCSTCTLFMAFLSVQVAIPQNLPTEPEPETVERDLPKTSVQIINATSVPEIELFVDEKPFYPSFKQGLYTADAPLPIIKPTYRAVDKASRREHTQKFQYERNTHQSMLITGNFSLVPPAFLEREDTPPAPDNIYPPADDFSESPKEDEDELVPYVRMTLLSHDLEPGQEPLRCRFFNGLPADPIKIIDGTRIIPLLPGEMVALTNQPAMKTYKAQIGEKELEVFMRQEGTLRNYTIIFYEKDEAPTFMRAFENSSKSIRADQLQSEN